jgi:hypothetical protein
MSLVDLELPAAAYRKAGIGGTASTVTRVKIASGGTTAHSTAPSRFLLAVFSPEYATSAPFYAIVASLS